MERILSAAKIAAIVFLIPASWATILFALWRDLNRGTVVDGEVDPLFPVLVVIRGEWWEEPSARIVYWRDLKKFLKEHPDHGFLVPSASEDRLRHRIQASCRSRRWDFTWESPDPWDARFLVERLPDGRQALRVDGTWDDDRVNVGWYDATEENVLPRRYLRYFGPSRVLKLAWDSTLYSLVLWGAGALVWWWLRRSRRRAAAAAR